MYKENFSERHIGPNPSELKKILNTIGVKSINHLLEDTLPKSIRIDHKLNLPDAITEHEFLKEIKSLSYKNKKFKTYIGLGYHDTFTPSVIQRNILENPGWYTAYTPYQAEIAQGRLEALLNFQTMVCDLTKMEIANASLLDESTSAAEAMTLLYNNRTVKQKTDKILSFFIDENILPQTKSVLETRAKPIGIKLEIGDISKIQTSKYFGCIIQYPGKHGEVKNYNPILKKLNQDDIKVVIAADLMSLVIIEPPNEDLVDVIVGTTQRFGIPLGYGGPHAAFFATKEKYKRSIPGRIIGVTKDMNGDHALRMALQTREQHIKREKATSNICTAQVLLAVMSSMYGVYHGPKGLKDIGKKIHSLTSKLSEGLIQLGYHQLNKTYFDTILVKVGNVSMENINTYAEDAKINFNYIDEKTLSISVDEKDDLSNINDILEVFAKSCNHSDSENLIKEVLKGDYDDAYNRIPENLFRTTEYLQNEVFNKYHSETEMMRYIKRLENKDLSLTHSMISLGSCTMKLNAASELLPLSWAELGNIHPFVPSHQARGYHIMFHELEEMLCEITGFDAMSLQPNSGAQGEFAGLMVIREYHKSRGDNHRNICLIPSSAHGTNPASAVMAGMKVVVTPCDENGNIDVKALREKAIEHASNLSCLMITYPSTHGVFEESVIEITNIIHENGGQVYMDGANMNAQVGLTNPARIGADVCNLNLHKTFAIPHGGGGPGMGPIGVAEHLQEFLPSNPIVNMGGENAIHSISSAPWGSSLVLTISYAYIKMLGAEGMKKATEIAILNANYLKVKLEKDYSILYTSESGRVAHEMIVDFREYKSGGVEVSDIAKRLMDYGFHAPTVSFPVVGTLMIEPTESESLSELDRFIETMSSIKQEINEVVDGKVDDIDNVLKNAPHTMQSVVNSDWTKPYSREKAVFPLDFVKRNKFWPSVRRVDDAFGDRNLQCTCAPVSDYVE